MDCNTGIIHHLNDEQIQGLENDILPELDGHILAPLTEAQEKILTPMNAHQRKGYMRNQPCVCGSGKKFKRCCWSKFS